MVERYGDIDWLNLSGDFGIQKTKALYRAFIEVAKRTGVTGDALLFQVLGEAETGGIDYIRNFRAGKIAKFKAEMIHHWLARSHFEQANAIAPDLFPYPIKDAFQEFIDTHAVAGKLRVIPSRRAIGIHQRSRNVREGTTMIQIGQDYILELETELDGYCIVFEGYRNAWYPLALGEDERRMQIGVSKGIHRLPRDDNGQPIALVELENAGEHQFVCIVSEDKLFTPNQETLATLADEEESYEVHIAKVIFTT